MVAWTIIHILMYITTGSAKMCTSYLMLQNIVSWLNWMHLSRNINIKCMRSNHHHKKGHAIHHIRKTGTIFCFQTLKRYSMVNYRFIFMLWVAEAVLNICTVLPLVLSGNWRTLISFPVRGYSFSEWFIQHLVTKKWWSTYIWRLLLKVCNCPNTPFYHNSSPFFNEHSIT